MADKDFHFKILSDNRQAGHNYFLLERFEAGMVLTGTEVKAAKAGKMQLKESYGAIEGNEAWLLNAHISEYSHGNRANHEPAREKGLSLVPTKVYLKEGRIKCELAVARGKKLHDKREAERARTAESEAREAIRASKSRGTD